MWALVICKAWLKAQKPRLSVDNNSSNFNYTPCSKEVSMHDDRWQWSLLVCVIAGAPCSSLMDIWFLRTFSCLRTYLLAFCMFSLFSLYPRCVALCFSFPLLSFAIRPQLLPSLLTSHPLSCLNITFILCL
jgi:hypothetical protein